MADSSFVIPAGSAVAVPDDFTFYQTVLGRINLVVHAIKAFVMHVLIIIFFR